MKLLRRHLQIFVCADQTLALNIINRAVENPVCTPWTTTHGHLLQMGGFRLIATQRENFFCKGLGPVLRTLSPWRREDLILERFHYRHETSDGFWSNDYDPDNGSTDNIWECALTIDALKRLFSESLIRFPTITEDEINDKSKGDALSKCIALLQLSWFIAQIITRAVQGLAITEIELRVSRSHWAKQCHVRLLVEQASRRSIPSGDSDQGCRGTACEEIRGHYVELLGIGSRIRLSETPLVVFHHVDQRDTQFPRHVSRILIWNDRVCTL